ncbi:molybdate ABC transporter permease subunit [Haliea sp.]|jgi:molybdate transport system permease protein|uniref:molybdate ABC transporter permease subunit n=1 Tax=Haliea TaxID=475794 RepID=UPI000C603720|nr:molybdate ABC transporter permease subunit [Haliea sp.]HBM84934.1 molybdate ABC transporter permease subunit [Halieaceae bacterium]MAD63052.1 molybdate ABC transporter permease subunit [Haliea sp.]MAY91555.1 molybdate ABC transporter permease subunit [Haliea sp.]MBK40538.1 molybdate ABC transporter permease subunit [Haliea sp.]MBP68637.1 molybdate ABC transporter permease subunit [Haliea sp.]|tara:strand:- start:3164 stop:3850 length:687 start_codon:yes stop_codon:yes gene_type:complete
MLSAEDLTALWVTLQLAAVSTVLLLLLATPLAWWLSQTAGRGRVLVEALVTLPLVLPPTVLGFYLLLLLGPEGAVGGTLERIGVGHLAFSFSGLVVGSMVYSLPFVVQPLQNAFAATGARLFDVAATLRASPLDRFLTIALPLARRGYLTAAVLAFAHTLGEFGVIIMLGGNIPGETRVASIAIYNHVESLDYGAAHALALTLVVLSLSLLTLVYAVNRRARVVGVPG